MQAYVRTYHVLDMYSEELVTCPKSLPHMSQVCEKSSSNYIRLSANHSPVQWLPALIDLSTLEIWIRNLKLNFSSKEGLSMLWSFKMKGRAFASKSRHLHSKNYTLLGRLLQVFLSSMWPNLHWFIQHKSFELNYLRRIGKNETCEGNSFRLSLSLWFNFIGWFCVLYYICRILTFIAGRVNLTVQIWKEVLKFDAEMRQRIQEGANN